MKRILCENQVIISDQKINLVVDVDDALLCKSISAQFWSILCYFHKLPSFTVGIYYGNKKWSNVKEFALEFFTKYRNLEIVDIEFRGVKLGIPFDFMHLALLVAVKRLILFWKEFLIDYLQYSDHKNFKQVGWNCWTASNRICVEATWIWWGKKVEGHKITTVRHFDSSMLWTISDLFSFLSKSILTERLTCCENSFRWKWN